MKQHYMTYPERCQLEALHRAGLPVKKIAEQLGFSIPTIYRELKRGAYPHTLSDLRTETRYSAVIAQQAHEYAQTAKGRPIKLGSDHAFAEFIEKQIIERHYSPGPALALARKKGYETEICVNTLYSYIEKKVFLRLRNRHLWRKGKRKPAGERPQRRVSHPQLPSIEKRPASINDRIEAGHWEKDLIIGKEGTHACLLTMVDRKLRKVKIIKLPDRKAETVKAAMDRLERQTANFREEFKSFTTDNGSEFLKYEELTTSIHGGKRFEVYYCHSYSPWEKGSIENHNGMIRRFFPKGTDFTKVSKRRIQEVEDWINNYPRRILGWKSPNEAAGAPLG